MKKIAITFLFIIPFLSFGETFLRGKSVHNEQPYFKVSNLAWGYVDPYTKEEEVIRGVFSSENTIPRGTLAYAIFNRFNAKGEYVDTISVLLQSHICTDECTGHSTFSKTKSPTYKYKSEKRSASVKLAPVKKETKEYFYLINVSYKTRDFNTDIKSMKLVNIVVNDEEVPYELFASTGKITKKSFVMSKFNHDYTRDDNTKWVISSIIKIENKWNPFKE